MQFADHNILINPMRAPMCAPSTNYTFVSFPKIDRECCVCYSNDINSFINVKCKHDVCHACADKIATHSNNTLLIQCPLCRAMYEWSLESGLWVSSEPAKTFSMTTFCAVLMLMCIFMIGLVCLVMYRAIKLFWRNLNWWKRFIVHQWMYDVQKYLPKMFQAESLCMHLHGHGV